MRVVGICLVALTACLSRPVGQAVGGADANGDGANGDGRPGTPWPPAGATITGSHASDLDGDGIVDLVLASTDGIYVLAGGPQFGKTYQTFVATAAKPLAFDVANMGGTSAPELGVLELSPASAGRVEIFEGLGGLGFASTAWRQDFPDLHPSDQKVRGLRLIDSDGDGMVNVVASDEFVLSIGEPAGFSAAAIEAMPIVRAEGPNSTSHYFFGLLSVFAIPGAGEAKLVIDDFSSALVFNSHGADHYLVSDRHDQSYGGSYTFSAHADLDGDGIPELVGGQPGFLGAMALEGTTPGVLTYSAPSLPPAHGGMDHAVAARFGKVDQDAAARLDLVMMEQFSTSGPVTDTEFVLVRDLVRTTGTVHGSDAFKLDVPGVLLVALEVGDFDHDGKTEVIAVEASGALRCWRYGDLSLDPC